MITDFIFGFFVFVFGLCIGSFLNCFIYRLEQDKSLKGRSFCPYCKHALSWRDLFPVFSFLFLKGKCRYCHKKISSQYPLVETGTALLFLVIFFTTFQYTILGAVRMGFLFYFSSVLIIIFVYDLKHKLIPEKILFYAIAAAIIYNLIPPNVIQNTLYGFAAAIIASGFFYSIYFISGGKWMGFGDVELAILMGLLLSIPNIFVALFLAFFFGAIIGLILMVFEKKNFKSEVPFAPFLIAGTFMALLYGGQIVQWYVHLFII